MRCHSSSRILDAALNDEAMKWYSYQHFSFATTYICILCFLLVLLSCPSPGESILTFWSKRNQLLPSDDILNFSLLSSPLSLNFCLCVKAFGGENIHQRESWEEKVDEILLTLCVYKPKRINTIYPYEIKLFDERKK